MDVEVEQVAGGELPDRVPAIGCRYDLEVEVGDEVDPRRHLRPRRGAGLVRHRQGDHIDAVPLDTTDDQVLARLDRREAELLRLSVELAPAGDAAVAVEEEVRRVDTAFAGRRVDGGE